MRPEECEAFHVAITGAAITFAYQHAEEFAATTRLNDFFKSTDELKICLRALGMSAALETLSVVAEQLFGKDSSDAKDSRH
jgi:hypothetical protein